MTNGANPLKSQRRGGVRLKQIRRPQIQAQGRERLEQIREIARFGRIHDAQAHSASLRGEGRNSYGTGTGTLATSRVPSGVYHRSAYKLVLSSFLTALCTRGP